MPDTDLLGTSVWVWPQSYWREGASAWLTAHKFGFLNGLDKAALARALVSLDPTGQQLAKSAPQHLFRRIATGRDYGKRPCARHDTLRAFTLEELFAEHLNKVSHPHIRFCPACMAEWFHASIFQLAGVRKCPVHHMDLESGCPGCGRPILAEFVPAQFAHPLCCWHCGRPFSGREPRFSELFGRTETEPERKAASIQRELVRLCHSTGVGGFASEFPYPDAAHLEVLLAGTRVRHRLDCAADGQWLGLRMHDCTRLKIDSSKAEEAFESSMRILRAIGRHLERSVRRHCGHRRPQLMALQRGRGGMMEPCWLSATYADRFFRPTRRGVCACCFALARWRVSFAAIFYAHQHHKRVHPVNLSAELDYLVESQVALDLFGLCVVQTAYAIGLDLSAPGSHDWIGKTDEEGRYLCVWPPPYWDVLRRNDGNTRRCAGYDVACIEDLLQRLANISLLDGPRLGIHLGCSRGAIWGQDIAEYRMKLSLPDPTAWLTQEYLEKTVQEVSLQMFQAMALGYLPRNPITPHQRKMAKVGSKRPMKPTSHTLQPAVPTSIAP